MTNQFGVVLRETKNKLVETMNASGLPIDAIDMLLGELKLAVHAQAEAEYQAEIAQPKESGEPLPLSGELKNNRS